jgi:hypothetical protein
MVIMDSSPIRLIWKCQTFVTAIGVCEFLDTLGSRSHTAKVLRDINSFVVFYLDEV